MSNNFIKHITLENYKSIQKLDLELKPLNVLIGSNGAGKSNFISFFNLILKSLNGTAKAYIIKQGGMDYLLYYGVKYSELISSTILLEDFGLEIKIQVTNDLMMPYIHHRYIDTKQLNMPIVIKDQQRDQYSKFVMDIINPSREQFEFHRFLDNIIRDEPSNYSIIKSSIQTFHFNDTSDTSPLKSTVANNDNLFLRADGQNLSCMIKLIYDKHPDYYRMIVDTIRNVVPDFHEFVIRQNSDFLTLEWFNKNNVDIPWKAHYLSDGSLRFIALAVLLLMPSELQPQVIIIDEPEIGLHPTAINVLSGLIKRASLERQVIISTQSAELLSQFEPNDVIVVDKKGKSSEFKRLNNADLAKWLEDYTLGELWETNIIGGRP